MDILKGMADQVSLGGALEAATHGAAGAIFKPVLGQTVQQTLEYLGPEAGKIAVAKMTEKYSIVKKIKSAQETAIKAASDAVISFKNVIMDFVEEAGHDPEGTFKKVGVILLRACRDAADKAVRAIMKSLPGCAATCIQHFANVKDIITKVYDSVVEGLKKFVNDTLKSKHVPQSIMDKIHWGSPDDDVGEPKTKSAPQPETMGNASS